MVHIREPLRVVGMNGSSRDKLAISWIDFYCAVTKRSRGTQKCCVKGCPKRAECGAHVWIVQPDGTPDKGSGYIMPTCWEHNGRRTHEVPVDYDWRKGPLVRIVHHECWQ